MEDRLIDGMSKLPQRQNTLRMALRFCGCLDAKKETIFHAPNMSKWDNRPLKKELQRALHTKNVFLENDTALVGLGEAVRGSGKGKQIVAYITVSTGINGVRIVNGEIDRSALGFEIGHQILDKNTRHTTEN